jgi:hypothetical protein
MSFNETLWVLEGKQICSKPNRMRDNRVQIRDELYNCEVRWAHPLAPLHIPPPPYNQPYPPSHPWWPSPPTGLNECTSLHVEGTARSAWYVLLANSHPSVSTS